MLTTPLPRPHARWFAGRVEGFDYSALSLSLSLPLALAQAVDMHQFIRCQIARSIYTVVPSSFFEFWKRRRAKRTVTYSQYNRPCLHKFFNVVQSGWIAPVVITREPIDSHPSALHFALHSFLRPARRQVGPMLMYANVVVNYFSRVSYLIDATSMYPLETS